MQTEFRSNILVSQRLYQRTPMNLPPLHRHEQPLGTKATQIISTPSKRNPDVPWSCNGQGRPNIAVVFTPHSFSEMEGKLSPKLSKYTWNFTWKAHLWESLTIIETNFKINAYSSSWQINDVFYKSDSDCQYKPGTINFALAWFQQAMAVCTFLWFLQITA